MVALPQARSVDLPKNTAESGNGGNAAPLPPGNPGQDANGHGGPPPMTATTASLAVKGAPGAPIISPVALELEDQIKAYKDQINDSDQDSERRKRRLKKFNDCVKHMLHIETELHIKLVFSCIQADVAHRNEKTIYDKIGRVAAAAALTVGTGVILSNIVRGVFPGGRKNPGRNNNPGNRKPNKPVSPLQCKRCVDIYEKNGGDWLKIADEECHSALFLESNGQLQANEACAHELRRMQHWHRGGNAYTDPSLSEAEQAENDALCSKCVTNLVASGGREYFITKKGDIEEKKHCLKLMGGVREYKCTNYASRAYKYQRAVLQIGKKKA